MFAFDFLCYPPPIFPGGGGMQIKKKTNLDHPYETENILNRTALTTKLMEHLLEQSWRLGLADLWKRFSVLLCFFLETLIGCKLLENLKQ